MRLRIPCEDYLASVTVSDRQVIARQIDACLAQFPMKKQELEELALSCVSEIANASAISRELTEQGTIKRFWGNLTGKNAKMQAALSRSNTNVQYAHQQILTCLMEQNASMMDFAVKLEKEHHQIVLEIDQRQLETNMQLKKVCLWLMKLDHVEKELIDELGHMDEELNRVVFLCNSCGHFVSRERSICPKCGQVLRSCHPSLKTRQGQEQFNRDIEKVSQMLKENKVMNRYPSKKGKAYYFDQIEQLERCIQNIGLPEEVQRSIQQRCDKMRLFLKKQHIEIAIAGSVKAGKSSLINALFDEEIAAVETTPETSVLTKYRTTRSGNYIRVQFYNEMAWKGIWSDACKSKTYSRDYQEANAAQLKAKWVNARPYHKNQLTLEELKAEVNRFTHSKSPDHFFVREVEVGICSNVFPNDVFLVDTPGLDDIVKARSNVTRRYLNQADAVLACVKADSIHESSEALFINRIMGNRRDKNTLFVVVTKKDQKSAMNFDKDYHYFLRNVLEEMFNPDEKEPKRIDAKNNCFGISALSYNEVCAWENGMLDSSSGDRYRQFIFMLLQMGYLEMNVAFAQPEELYSCIRRNVSAVKEYSGIPSLKEQLYKRFITSARKIKQQAAEAEFSKFRRDVNTLLATQISSFKELLQPLNADENELMQMREQLKKAEHARQQLQAAIKTVRNGGYK